MHSNDLGGEMRLVFISIFLLIGAGELRAETSKDYLEFLNQQRLQQLLQRAQQQGGGFGSGGSGAQIQPRRSHSGSEPKLDLEKEAVQQMQQSVQKTLEQNQKLAEQVISKSSENPFGKDDKPLFDLNQIANGTEDFKPVDPKPLLDAYSEAGHQIARYAIQYATVLRQIREETNRPVLVLPKVSERLQSLPTVDRQANVERVLADAKPPAEPASERTHSGSRAARGRPTPPMGNAHNALIVTPISR